MFKKSYEAELESIKKKGEYLGYCPQKKGWLYSVYKGINKKGHQEYAIVYISQGEVHHLISHEVKGDDNFRIY